MRFERIEFRAFGPFTDKVLDLSGGNEGLYVVYGPNEAGKSSALRAIHDLLYGIPARSPDNFLHDYSRMRIAALIRDGEDELFFVRRKGNTRTLLDDAEQPLDESVLDRLLYGVNENVFKSAFGFGNKELEKSASEMLESGGDIGQSIFGASLGDTGLFDLLRDLDDEADDLFKPQAQNPKINKALRIYKQSTDEVRIKSIPARQWTELQEELAELQQHRESLDADLKRVREQLRVNERIRSAFEPVLRREEFLNELSELGAVPDHLPDDFGSRRSAAVEELRAARRRIEGAQNGKEIIEKRLGEIHVPLELLKQEDAITDLHGRVAQYRDACADRPKREQERNEHRERAEQLWRESELRERAIRGMDSSQAGLDAELAQGIDTVITDLTLHENADSQTIATDSRERTLLDRVITSCDRIQRAKSELEHAREALRHSSAASTSIALMVGSMLVVVVMVMVLLVTRLSVFVGIPTLIIAAVGFAFGLYRRLESTKRARHLDERIEQAKRYTGELDSISRELNDVQKFDERIETIENSCRRFETDIASIQGLASDSTDVEPDRLVERWNRELGPAKVLRTKSEQLTEQHERLNDALQKTQQQESAAREELAELCRIASCGNYEELEIVEKRYQRREDLQEKVQSVERELVRICGDRNKLDAFVETVRNADEGVITQDIEALSSKETEFTEQLDKLKHTIGAKENERNPMDGSDEAAAAADEAESVLAEIRTHVDRYVRVKFAHRILRDEIEKYRVENQGPILKAASGFFARLTLGSFTGLKTEYDEKDEPVLMGIRAGAEQNLVAIGGMSEGTADQLYLSLRLAALEHYVSRNKPLPFIVDDILIKFDDDRARAALEVLTDLSDRVQVLFFTHHMRLREIAEDLQSENGQRVFVQDLRA